MPVRFELTASSSLGEVHRLSVIPDGPPISKNGDILSLFAKDFAKVIAGEAANGKLLYLVATSRLFDKTMHAAIKGTSAGGKSEIRKQILQFFPPESVVSFTSLSEKALIYHQGDFAHKILSMGEATATDEQSFQDYVLRELMSEGRISHSTVQQVGKNMAGVTIEKQGPVSFLITTTKNKLHPENETRMLSLEIDDTEHQTKEVLKKVAQVEGLNHTAAQVDYKPWQEFQRWLETGERRVLVPFADALAELIPPKAVRLRRDIGQVIRAIKAHALLHREQREKAGDGQIVADIERDYRAVRELMHAILAEGSGVAIKKEMQETIKAVENATVGLGETEGASAQQISKALMLDKSAAWRRLSAARYEGLIVNLEQRRGMPGKYRVTPQAADIGPEIAADPETDILPEPKKVAEQAGDRGASLPKTVQPCNREQKPLTLQADNGCKGACNRLATEQPVASGCVTVARGLATVKPMNGQEKSSPVAGLHANLERGGSASEQDRACAQCGAGLSTDPPSDAPTIEVANGKGTVWLHAGRCHQFWREDHQQT